MRVVIADDLSGAAELAGLAHRCGHAPRLQTATAPLPAAAPALLILDADTRERSPAEAAQLWRTLTTRLHAAYPQARFFKKCDSVLRGHIAREASAMAGVLGVSRILLLPANPSRGRIIRQGRYLIDGVPLDQTAFAHDPAHPATSAVVADLLGPDAAAIEVPDLTNPTDLANALATVTPETLVVGAADAFAAWCPTAGPLTSSPPPPSGRLLIINGSTAPFAADKLRARGFRCLAPRAPLPTVHTALRTHGRVHVAVGADDLERLHALARLAAETANTHLALTGGATARGACEALGLDRFTVSTEWAPGVVALLPPGPAHPGLTFKPGSYAWPDCFLDHFTPPAAS